MEEDDLDEDGCLALQAGDTMEECLTETKLAADGMHILEGSGVCRIRLSQMIVGPEANVKVLRIGVDKE